MIQEVQDLIKVISHLPDYVLWVLAGLLFYKIFIIGNIYAVLRLAINKLYDYLINRNKEVKHEVTFKGLSLDEGVDGILLSLLSKVRTDSNKYSNYLRSSDILELTRAWEEYQARKVNPNA